jgi:hypothetical protein
LKLKIKSKKKLIEIENEKGTLKRNPKFKIEIEID